MAEAAAAPKKKLAEGKGAIAVSSMTKGAKVYVDDIEVGEVPLKQPIEVDAKHHIVRVQKRGYFPFQEAVTPRSGETVELEVDLLAGATLQLQSGLGDQKLQVLLDGRLAGVTPLESLLQPGQHIIEARAAGFLPQTRVFDAQAGQELAFTLTLQPVPAPIVKEDKSLLSRWWFWTAVGAAVVGGVAGGVVLSQDTKVAPRLPDHVLTLQ
jgi:hypothetical protein